MLRIDPLFPSSPLADGRTLEDFGLPEAQTNDDLDHLVALAKELNVRHVVYSPTKIVQPRGRRLQPLLLALRDVYRAMAAPEKLDFHGGSWRLPDALARMHIAQPFLDVCARQGVIAKYCKRDLIEAP
ncbi:MAG: hypothetical protein JXO22_13270 [Phycisphaerae bacterium]|nr:hypothetical protein [Phycisphaerae bacterium]